MIIYLDNAATTPVSRNVLDEMSPYFSEKFGNAGTLYSAGREAKKAIDKARGRVAALFGCDPARVFFNSGASEGNNTVFHGLAPRLRAAGATHLVVSAVEHESVLGAAAALEKEGFSVSYISPDTHGVITCQSVEQELRSNTGLVSVMYCNNETGAVNEVEAIGKLCRQKGILFHCDCVQAAGQYVLDVKKNCIDFATISGHKIHGPKGVGALYAAEDINPLIHGGSHQERGQRGGTENVPGIVGLGAACASAAKNMRENRIIIQQRKQSFVEMLCRSLGAQCLSEAWITVNGRSYTNNGKVLNLHIQGVDGETLVLALDAMGVCISAGSACQAHNATPSHVLMAMGKGEGWARQSVRISFSEDNTEAGVLEAAAVMAAAIGLLRRNGGEM